jgi:type I restriction enzyme R subunit
VHELGKAPDPREWSEEKTRNETDLIKTRVRKTIEQDLAEDPYAQKVFGELLRQAIAEAEAMFDHPLKQHALFKAFEQRIESRETPGIPLALAENRHAMAYFGALKLVLGDAFFGGLDEAELGAYVNLTLEIDRVVRDAIAENSLSPQSIEAAVRKALLPKLFSKAGLDQAKAMVEQIVQIVRVGLSRA